MCGPQWYMPMQTFDMCSGSAWGSMNIHMNQAWDDMAARSYMGMTPIYEFNNFMPYGSIGGNSYLLDPRYTMMQMDWMNKQQGGPGFFNSDGQFQIPMTPWGNMGWNPTGSTNGSTKPSTETAEDRKFQRNYTTLLNLIKQMKDDESFSPTERDVFLAASNMSTKGTWKEKFEALKTEYEKVSKANPDAIKDFLTKTRTIGTDGTSKTDNAKSFHRLLLSAGYEYSGGIGADDHILDLHNSIDSLSNNNGNIRNDKILGSIKSGAFDILDVISSWNNTYAGGSASEKRLIKYLAEKCNAISDEQMRKDAINDSVIVLTNCLINKANGLKANLDNDGKEKLQNAINNVTTALTNSSDKVAEDLWEHFDHLYLVTRDAAMKQIRAQVTDYYGEVDPDIFNDNLFVDDTDKDLEEEGFSADAINRAKVDVKTRPGQRTPGENTQPETVADKVAKAVTNGYLKTKTVTLNGEETTVYQEKVATGDRDYQRVYILQEDGLHELEGVKLNEDDTLSDNESIPSDNPTDLEKIKAEIQKVEAAEKERNDRLYEISRSLSDKEKTDAKKLGKDIEYHLAGSTGSDEQTVIKKQIEQEVDSTNVFYVLRGYKDNRGSGNWWYFGADRFFEQMFKEYWDEEENITYIKKMLSYVIENLEAQAKKASEENIKKSIQDDITKLKELYAKDNDNLTKADCKKIDVITYFYIKKTK